MTGPAVEILICIAWIGAGLLGLGLILAGGWALLVLADIFALPFLTRWIALTPVCWILGHIEGEAFAIGDHGEFYDVCPRCGRRELTDED